MSLAWWNDAIIFHHSRYLTKRSALLDLKPRYVGLHKKMTSKPNKYGVHLASASSQCSL
jgi:hypothetical protein